ncbi:MULTISPECIES: hypothetical protein [Pseudoalteromonas]|uniref:Uncharacterized protein n=1 Tax=Pseudoalteromonas prydzensis TaxID=182141 RepID=A0ABR9FHX8_9GAMM|nr:MULTISPECIES: hypothetical protein [Pseudoalteromonas]MBE0376864.1 hypothetical protein [Pseudoalteromonas prydzensis ACAM 620]MBE0456407.1 hypothetical protein [Pseudoalteromonas prydzensis]WKD22189.1 hypothetical protein NDQ71_10875 [Pseudoalteromonas sp. KG3]
MGVRLAMRKELMGLNNSDMLTADDVRAHLTHQVKQQPHSTHKGFSVISKFNDNHSQLLSGDNNRERLLEFQRHRLFKDVLYTKQSVDAWLNSQIN